MGSPEASQRLDADLLAINEFTHWLGREDPVNPPNMLDKELLLVREVLTASRYWGLM